MIGIFRAELLDVLSGSSRVIEIFAGRHRNIQALEKIFGGALAVLQDRSLFLGAQDSLAFFLEDIDNTIGQVAFRPDKGHVYPFLFCKSEQFKNGLGRLALHRCQAALLYHLAACIAGSHEYRLHAAASGKGMGYGISSASCVHYENSFA